MNNTQPQYQKSEAISRAILAFLIVGVVLVIGFFVLRYAYTAWYIETHCTYILGTRVCQN